MLKPTPKSISITPDIVIAVILAILPWIIHESDFLELLRWAAVIYLLGTALLYKYFALRGMQK